MEITIKIPDELAAQAQARGLDVETYVEEILAQRVGASLSASGQARTPEEIRGMAGLSGTILRQDPTAARNDFPRVDLSGPQLGGDRFVSN
jgi:hypothetical protein